MLTSKNTFSVATFVGVADSTTAAVVVVIVIIIVFGIQNKKIASLSEKKREEKKSKAKQKGIIVMKICARKHESLSFISPIPNCFLPP